MGKVAVEHIFTGTTTPYTSYDSTKTVLGSLIVQKTGDLDTDKFAGPMPLAIARIGFNARALGSFTYPMVITVNSTIDWVFLADINTAAAVRDYHLFEFNKSTQVFTWKGWLNITFPTATNHTIRGHFTTRYLYTTGTVAVSGTAVTGTTTAWQTARFASGARIGFGSTNPDSITTWYDIATITNDTSITLVGSAGTIAGGTSFVIEELRIAIATTNATAANGGLFLVKGVSASTFCATGAAIPAATTVDNIRACYWLSDAEPMTSTIAIGLAVDAPASNTLQDCYLLHAPTTTSLRFFKFNLRTALSSISSGKTTSAFAFKTGVATTLVGTLGASNNGRLGTLNHGMGANEKSIFFTTTNKIYRTPVSLIADGSIAFVKNVMTEIPPGGGSATVYPLAATFQSVDISNTIDRLIINQGTTSKSYVTKFYSDISEPFDHIYGVSTRLLNGAFSRQSEITPFFELLGTYHTWTEGGIAYNSTSAGLVLESQRTLAIPLAAHWDYAGGTVKQRLITPELATPLANSLYRLYANHIQLLGSDHLGIPPEPYRCYVRTTGITDDSGDWTLILNGDLTNITPASTIQVMIEFRILGLGCVPARIHSVAVVYDQITTDNHYQTSLALSEKRNGRFVWWFATAFGSSVPALRVRIYNATTNELLDSDNTASPTGVFERSTDGGSTWTSWNNTDRGNNTTYLRYTYRPGDLVINNITTKAILTLN